MTKIKPHQTWSANPRLWVAWTATAAGALAMLPLPTALSAPLLGLFLLAGPGSVILMLAPPLPDALRWALMPALGLAVILLLTAAMAALAIWSPLSLLAGLVACSVAALATLTGRQAQHLVVTA